MQKKNKIPVMNAIERQCNVGSVFVLKLKSKRNKIFFFILFSFCVCVCAKTLSPIKFSAIFCYANMWNDNKEMPNNYGSVGFCTAAANVIESAHWRGCKKYNNNSNKKTKLNGFYVVRTCVHKQQHRQLDNCNTTVNDRRLSCVLTSERKWFN